MNLYLTPGNAVGCKVNSHRSGWDGSICSAAESWKCGADPDFRADYCSQGVPRCYHLHMFEEAEPYLIVDDTGGGWIFQQEVRALDDQVLLLWGNKFHEPRGIRESGPAAYQIFGAYRILRVTREEQRHRVLWRIDPHPDGWTRFHQFRIDQPRYSSMGGPYLKQMDRKLVIRAFDDACDAASRADPGWYAPSDADRFQHFYDHLLAWLDEGAERARELGLVASPRVAAPPKTSVPWSRPLKDLGSMVKVVDDPAREPEPEPELPATAVAEAPDVDSDRVPPLIEPHREPWILDTHGRETLLALKIAARTKHLLILRGNPGVGKSHLAVRLLDDPERERTLVVPVAATWRGREDLLGYVNPIHNEFEPTPFTLFLTRAADAWRSGDRRPRLVVFEEFNLSQPEHWLSDILSIAQYDLEADRKLRLGGSKIRGMEEGSTEVFLSPALYCVGTINSDHTTRPLSPRVLDRAAVVHLTLDPSEALSRAGLELREEQTLAIAGLDHLLSPRGASFSIRTAKSLKECLADTPLEGPEDWEALDVVLVQEVLSKVRLMARNPIDENLVQELKKWSEAHGSHLRRCSSLIAEWSEALESGTDVVQA